MVKQTTKYFGIAAALALCLSLTGCESWRRAAPDSPKELPVYSEQMTEPSTEASDEQPVERENAQALTVGQNSQTKESGWVTAVSITRTSDSAQAFVSADEMLSQKAYDLITHQNERFDENFDERRIYRQRRQHPRLRAVGQLPAAERGHCRRRAKAAVEPFHRGQQPPARHADRTWLDYRLTSIRQSIKMEMDFCRSLSAEISVRLC